MTVLQGFTAGMFEGWTRLPTSDRCRIVIVALAVPCAVALALAVRPPQRPPGTLFLGLQNLETTKPWAVHDEFKDGRRTEAAPAVQRAEVIVESDRVLPGGVTPSAKAAWASRATWDAESPHERNSRAMRPESQR